MSLETLAVAAVLLHFVALSPTLAPLRWAVLALWIASWAAAALLAWVLAD